MTAGLLVQCPSCEQQFAVRIDPIDPALKGQGARGQGTGPAASSSRPAAASSPRSLEVAWREDTGWELNCPTHEWTTAREWPQSAKGPACIQCQGKTNGTWCTVRVPLAEAQRLAGVR